MINKTKMKTVGLVGGIAWTSSSYYYKMMNTGINKKYSDLSSSRSIMYSLNLQDYIELAYNEDKKEFKELIADAAVAVFNAGAEFLVICSNTAHMAVERIEEKCKENKIKNFVSKELSILHITDCCAYEIKLNYPKIKKIGLIGTIFTMKSKHVIQRLEEHGFEVAVPKREEDKRIIMDIIENELSKDIFDNPDSINTFLNIISKLEEEEKIEGIVLGCTEIPLLIKDRKLSSGLIIFDATEMHINSAVKVQLGEANM